MITFQVEPYDVCHHEIDSFLQEHFEEVAISQNVMVLSKDEPAYQRMADEGQLSIVTVRKDGVLIGYHATIIKTHLHYSTTLCGFVDVYFLRKHDRKGLTGKKLIEAAEKELTRRGVVKVFSATKKHLDMSKLFLRMGWTEQEAVFCKVLNPPKP